MNRENLAEELAWIVMESEYHELEVDILKEKFLKLIKEYG